MNKMIRRLALFALAGLVWSVTAGSVAEAQETRGAARAVDGDTLEIAGRIFHLRGIDAPEPGQTCDWPERTIDCGEIARLALMDLVAGAAVACMPAGTTADGEATALCVAGGFDLSANMVHTGWALADPQSGGEYADIEARARAARRGVWKGGFDPPWEWRNRR